MKKLSLIITIFLLLFISCDKYEPYVNIHIREYIDFHNFGYSTEINWSIYTKDSVLVYNSIASAMTSDDYQDYYIPVGEYFICIKKSFFYASDTYSNVTITNFDLDKLAEINQNNPRAEFVVK